MFKELVSREASPWPYAIDTLGLSKVSFAYFKSVEHDA